MFFKHAPHRWLMAATIFWVTSLCGCAVVKQNQLTGFSPHSEFDQAVLSGESATILLGFSEKARTAGLQRSMQGFAEGFQQYVNHYAPAWRINQRAAPDGNNSRFLVELNQNKRAKMKDPFMCRAEFITSGLNPIRFQVEMPSGVAGSFNKESNNINQHYNLGILAARELMGHLTRGDKRQRQAEENVTDISPPRMGSMQPPEAYKPAGVHWAVIVGISRYKDSRIPSLRYAVADATAFYKWIVSPTGAKYAPAHVKLLLEQEATAANLKEALFDWLRQALAEDTVIIYFACHGSPDSPDSGENLYLLPYDAHYDKISTTGFPMWDIETALKRFIKAKRVVVIADACHSGGVGQQFDIARRAARGLKVNSISAGFQSLSQIAEGICVLSASDKNQFSQEGRQWGGGHGVFTHFLIRGLDGEADYNEDQAVTMGELIPFVSQQVRRETRNAQSPTIAGRFDPTLRIAR